MLGFSEPTTGFVPAAPPEPDIELENTSLKAKQPLFHSIRNDELKSDPRNEIKKLRELARASFSGKLWKTEEGSCSYAPREQRRPDETLMA